MRRSIVAGAAAALVLGAPAEPATAEPTDAGAPDLPDAGPTAAVTFESDRPLVSVYLAQGQVSDSASLYPDPFKKLGRTPVTVQLAPGTYTIHVESPDIPVASTIVQVGDGPTTVRVRGGSDGLRTLSTFLLAAGATALLAGIVVEASYSQAPNGISKSMIAVPLFIGAGVGVGAGVAFWFAAKPDFQQTPPAPVAGGLSLVF